MAEIGINLRADPSAFISGTKAAEKAMDEFEKSAVLGADDIAEKLEAVIRQLVELGTASGKSKDDIVSDLRVFGLSAEQAEDAVRAVWDEMGEGQRAARDVQDAAESFEDVSKNADDAADATKRVGDETTTTGGKFSELGGIARDVLEGDFGGAAESAIGSLAALGAFAGVGGALAGFIGQGVGSIIGDWLGQWERASEATKERISSMYADLLESGRTFVSDEFITKRIAEIYDPENVDEFNKAVEFSNQLGVDRQTIIQAMAGDQEALTTVQAGAAETLADLNAKQEEHILKYGDESAAIADQIGEAERGTAAFDTYAGAQDTAAQRAKEAADAIRGVGGESDTAAGKVQGLTDNIAKIPDEHIFKVTANTEDAEASISRFIARPRSPIEIAVFYKPGPGGPNP